MMQITIFTDGACDIHAGNQPGGWAAILCATDDRGQVLKETVVSGGQEMTTNNQMELTAVIAGLKKLRRPSLVTIVSDSRYVIDIASKRKRSRKNAELWEKFFAEAARHQIDWVFIEGHSGHAYNERCDKIAVAEKNKYVKDNGVSPADINTSSSDIRIYLSTAYSGKTKDSAWSATILVSDSSDECGERLADTTEQECVLASAIACLRDLPTDQSVTLFTAQEYLSRGMTQWVPNWLSKGWKTQTGQPVKYQSHWKDLWQISRGRRVDFVFVKSRGDDPYFLRGKAHCAELMKQAR